MKKSKKIIVLALLLAPFAVAGITFIPRRAVEQAEVSACLNSLNGSAGERAAYQAISRQKNGMSVVGAFSTVLYYAAVIRWAAPKKKENK